MIGVQSTYSPDQLVVQVHLKLHGAIWTQELGPDGDSALYQCGVLQAAFNTNRPVSSGFSGAMAASLELSTITNRLFTIHKIANNHLMIAVKIGNYRLLPATNEMISPIDIPAICTSSPLKVCHQQQWMNNTRSMMTMQPSELIVARTAHFSGNFFEDGVKFDNKLRGTSVSYPLDCC